MSLLKDIDDLLESCDVNSRYDWVKKVKKISQNDPYEINADFRFKNLEDEGAKQLGKALEHNTKIQTIDLASNNITDKGFGYLLSGFQKVPTLTAIDLSLNPLSEVSGQQVVELLKTNPNITKIGLIKTKIPVLLEAQISRLAKENASKSPEEKERVRSSISTSTTSSSKKKTGSSSSRSTERGSSKDKEKKKDSGSKHRVTISSSPVPSSNPPINLSGDEDMKKSKDSDDTEKRLRQRIEELERQLDQKEVEILELERKVGSSTGGIGEKGRTLEIRVDNVQVHEKLADTGGSNAGVYSCSVDGWICAMKEMDLRDVDKSSSLSFESEIQLIEQIPFHPNIVRYLFHDKTPSKIRLFMTKYAGSLRNILNTRRSEIEKNGGKLQCPFPLRDLVKYCLDMIKGIDFLHSHQIVHRDLKSDNVFVTLNERKEIYQLAIGDFDTAKRVVKSKQAKTVIGTPGYIAPEVLNSSDDSAGYSFKVDVFSFGMILYELLSLKLPYEDENPWLVSDLIMKGQKPAKPIVPREYVPIFNLYEKCVSYEPENRPTVANIKEELIGYL